MASVQSLSSNRVNTPNIKNSEHHGEAEQAKCGVSCASDLDRDGSTSIRHCLSGGMRQRVALKAQIIWSRIHPSFSWNEPDSRSLDSLDTVKR
jgi:hypothetical protein